MPIVRSRTFTAIPPGNMILDRMDSDRMAFDEFAEKMSIPFRDSSALINGDIELTPAIAEQLEKVFDIPVQVWLDYEKGYREEIRQANAENDAADARRVAELQLALA